MPNCGYCKDCKHWGRKPSDMSFLDRKERTWRNCDNHWKLFRAYGWECSGEATAPDFGCIQCEPKEPTDP